MTKKTAKAARGLLHRRWLWWTVGGLAAAIGVLYVAGYFMTGVRMPAQTTVAQVDVGGMEPAEAVKTLEDGVADRLDEPLIVSHGDQTFEVVPSEAGLELDAKQSIDAAGLVPGARLTGAARLLAF